MFVQVPEPVTDENSYEADIAAVLGVSPERAAAVAAEYPPSTYPAAIVAFSTLVSDANFACPALQVDRGPRSARGPSPINSTTTTRHGMLWVRRRPDL